MKQKALVLSYIFLIAWMAVIFMLSSEGSDTSSGRSDVIVQTVQSWGVAGPTDVVTFLVRKSAHIVAYFILGILAWNVLRHYSLSARKRLALGVMIVLLYAASDEFHQLFVPGRSGEVRDVVIDTVAGAAGLLVVHGLSRWRAGRLQAASAGKKSQNKV